jgi:hypothetical protein
MDDIPCGFSVSEPCPELYTERVTYVAMYQGRWQPAEVLVCSVHARYLQCNQPGAMRHLVR